MPSPLRAETAKLRRDHILKAAADVFAKQGFRGATIKQVAKTAGVADGTIYNVFANKDAMLDALLDRLRPDKGGVPETTLAGLLQQRAGAFDPDTLKILRVVMSEALVDPQLRARFLRRVIDPAIEPLEMSLKGQSSAADTSRLMVATFVGLVVLKLLGETHVNVNSDAMLRSMADLFATRIKP
jgi:AcrR family transcriptional regulator